MEFTAAGPLRAWTAGMALSAKGFAPSMLARRLSLSLLILCLASTPAVAGSVRGVVRVTTRATAAPMAGNPYPGRAGSLPGAHAPMLGAPGDAVVYIDRLPAGVDSALSRAASAPKLEQRDQAFAPRVLAVAVGTTVDFPNRDPIYHNVFSVSPVRRFDLGKYPRGRSKSVRFDKPGLVNVYCDIHSDMAAFILVLPHHAFARPDADGRFVLPDLPPGRYTLRVWHPDLPELRRDIEIPAKGDLQVELSL